MIKALITDFGGVLVRTRTDDSRRALEQRLGLPPNTIEARVFASELSLQGDARRDQRRRVLAHAGTRSRSASLWA